MYRLYLQVLHSINMETDDITVLKVIIKQILLLLIYFVVNEIFSIPIGYFFKNVTITIIYNLLEILNIFKN